jgi:hypothetical protein
VTDLSPRGAEPIVGLVPVVAEIRFDGELVGHVNRMGADSFRAESLRGDGYYAPTIEEAVELMRVHSPTSLLTLVRTGAYRITVIDPSKEVRVDIFRTGRAYGRWTFIAGRGDDVRVIREIPTRYRTDGGFDSMVREREWTFAGTAWRDDAASLVGPLIGMAIPAGLRANRPHRQARIENALRTKSAPSSNDRPRPQSEVSPSGAACPRTASPKSVSAYATESGRARRSTAPSAARCQPAIRAGRGARLHASVIPALRR